MDISKILRYKKYIANGDHDGDFLQQLADRYTEQENNAISPYAIIINSSRANTVYRDGIPYQCIVDYNRIFQKSGTIKSIFHKELITRTIDEFKPGDIIEHSDTDYENKKYYLLLKTEHLRGGFDHSIMLKCHGILRWINQYGEIKEIPFTYRSDTVSTYGIENGKFINISNERRNILIPLNEETSQFKKEKRFIFDGRAWKIITKDSIEFDNIIHLILEEDQINTATDNVDLEIADYFNGYSNYKIEILNGSIIDVNVNDILQLNVVVKKNNEIVNEKLIFSSSNEEIATVSDDGLVTFISEGEVVITVALENNNSIMSTITINIQELTIDNYSIFIEGSNEIKYGQSKQYYATVFNNGVVVDGEVSFQLFADDMSTSTQLATIIEQNNNFCVVKNNNSNSGYVQLRVQLLENPDIVEWKRIQMKPIF
jgi:Bacterial Ig-like domain (group 2).